MTNADPRPKVYLVGAGPGDPGLLTLRAAQVLAEAEVLLYDALAGDAIVGLVPSACKRIFVGKRAGDHAMTQEAIEALLVRKAREGAHVVRLKGGDPFVFGRGGEEAQALHRAGIAFEIVPGISSALAAPAYAGIPVTHREYNAAFTVATGHEDPTKPASSLDWAKLADPRRTLVLLMATANLHEIAQRLIAHGLAPQTPAAVVQDGTRPGQRTVAGTLATIADDAERNGITAPAIAIVGDVVRLREEIRWFDTGALFGKRVLITRAGPQSDAFARALLARGAEPIAAPAIAIEPPGDVRPAHRAIDELAAYAWILFTSQNGVEAFFERLASLGKDARYLAGVRVAAIGERTARRLQSFGILADLVPAAFVAEEMASALIEKVRAGERLLLYRAQEARDALPQMLESAGLSVTIVAAYQTVVARDPEFTKKVDRADVLTFTSASTVRGFVSLLGDDERAVAAAGGRTVACIGPITAQAARDAGLQVDVLAASYTTAALLDALDAHFAARARC